jgi:hypothetical protein
MLTVSIVKKIMTRASRKRGLSQAVDIVAPQKDWRLFLGFFFLINIVAVILSAYLFAEINAGSIFQTEPNQAITVETLDREALADVLSRLNERALLFEHYGRNKPNLIDPAGL